MFSSMKATLSSATNLRYPTYPPILFLAFTSPHKLSTAVAVPFPSSNSDMNTRRNFALSGSLNSSVTIALTFATSNALARSDLDGEHAVPIRTTQRATARVMGNLVIVVLKAVNRVCIGGGGTSAALRCFPRSQCRVGSSRPRRPPTPEGYSNSPRSIVFLSGSTRHDAVATMSLVFNITLTMS